MKSTKCKKIVWTDNNEDKAVLGDVVGEDEFFIEIISTRGKLFKIGKKAIVCIKDPEVTNDDRK